MQDFRIIYQVKDRQANFRRREQTNICISSMCQKILHYTCDKRVTRTMQILLSDFNFSCRRSELIVVGEQEICNGNPLPLIIIIISQIRLIFIR